MQSLIVNVKYAVSHPDLNGVLEREETWYLPLDKDDVAEIHESVERNISLDKAFIDQKCKDFEVVDVMEGENEYDDQVTAKYVSQVLNIGREILDESE